MTTATPKTAAKTVKKTGPAKSFETKLEAKDTREVVKNAAEMVTKNAQTGLKNIAETSRETLMDATTALIETGELIQKNRHAVMFAMLDNARVNAEASFKTVRNVLAAEKLSDTFEIQRDAFRTAVDRNLEQAREVTTLAFEGTRESVKPINTYVANVGEKLFKKST